MRKIERVYVACYRSDLRLTRILIASIRNWYPDIPIFLIKDEINGRFSTREIEHRWGARVFPTQDRLFGWGFAKLEPLFDRERVRYLMLDSDIVFLGRVIDRLEQFEHDFVVQEETQTPESIAPLYFSADGVRATLDPSFIGPEFTFNSGQYVGTSGLFSRNDFDDLVAWTTPRRVRLPAVFNPSDQGVLNYALLRKRAAGDVRVARTPFMKWGVEEIRDIDLAALDQQSPYANVIHWAGLKAPRLRDMIRADILQHFEAMYYRALPYGRTKKFVRIASDHADRIITQRLKNYRRRLISALGR